MPFIHPVSSARGPGERGVGGQHVGVPCARRPLGRQRAMYQSASIAAGATAPAGYALTDLTVGHLDALDVLAVSSRCTPSEAKCVIHGSIQASFDGSRARGRVPVAGPARDAHTSCSTTLPTNARAGRPSVAARLEEVDPRLAEDLPR